MKIYRNLSNLCYVFKFHQKNNWPEKDGTTKTKSLYHRFELKEINHLNEMLTIENEMVKQNVLVKSSTCFS